MAKGARIEIDTHIMLTCSDCHPTVNVEDERNCRLERFQEAFYDTDRTPTDLDRIAREQGLDSAFYMEQNGIGHFRCPEAKGISTGRIAIFPRET